MATEPFHILLADPYGENAVERLRSVGEVTSLDTPADAELKDAICNCDALLVRTYTTVTRTLLDSAKRLRVIGRAGAGLDNIDLQAAADRGIVVVHTPAAATDAVADLTVGLMLSLLRGIPACDAMIRSGRFHDARTANRAKELRELTIGIIGLGRIGRAVARRCQRGFQMRVLYHDILQPGLMDFVATPAERVELYQEADILSLHVPLTDKTHHLIDATILRQLRKHALLINTSRGGVVDSDALAEALHAGTLAGAALDVVAPEPLPQDHALLSAPNTILTPHIGARSFGGLMRMEEVVEDVIRVLEGRPPRFPAEARDAQGNAK